jgi:hypothetical protein
VSDEDVEFLHHLFCSPPLAATWQYGGEVVHPRLFAENLRNVLSHFIVWSRHAGARIGYVAAFAPDFQAGHARLTLGFVPHVHGHGWPLEAGALFVDHLFRNWNLRKLYADVPEPTLDRMRSAAGRLFDIEARMPAHAFAGGRPCAMYTVAVRRVAWEQADDPVTRLATT